MISLFGDVEGAGKRLAWSELASAALGACNCSTVCTFSLSTGVVSLPGEVKDQAPASVQVAYNAQKSSH